MPELTTNNPGLVSLDVNALLATISTAISKAVKTALSKDILDEIMRQNTVEESTLAEAILTGQSQADLSSNRGLIPSPQVDKYASSITPSTVPSKQLRLTLGVYHATKVSNIQQTITSEYNVVNQGCSVKLPPAQCIISCKTHSWVLQYSSQLHFTFKELSPDVDKNSTTIHANLLPKGRSLT